MANGEVGDFEPMRIVADLRAVALALVQPGFVLVLDLPDLEPNAELGIPGELDDHDVGYVDDGRLVVLSRTGSTATLHIVDPSGPSKLGEVGFPVPARIAGIAGEHVLITTGNVTSVVDINAEPIVATPLRVRGHLAAAGRTGPNRFVLAVGGVLEEWDASLRAPGRRLRLDHPVDPAFVGGSSHHLWMVPKQQPDVVDVVVLSTRSTRRIELPEPALRVAAHPDGHVIAVIGATTRSAFIVDVTRATPVMRVEGGPMVDVAWVGRGHTLAIKPANAPLELLSIAMPDDATGRHRPAPPRPGDDDAIAEPPRPRAPTRPERPRVRWTREDISQRLAAWRARYTNKNVDQLAPAPPVAVAAEAADAAETVPAIPALRPTEPSTHPGGWRAALVAWVRAGGGAAGRPTLDDTGLDAVASRLQLGDLARHALALLYGAHLDGRAVSVHELASALGWDWAEALGNGALAASDLAHWRAGRVRLRREVVAALDERDPLHGAVLADDGGPPADSTVAIVAPAGVGADELGAWVASTLGALLVPRPGLRDWRGLVREARVRGVVPLVRWDEVADVLEAPPQPAAIVVEHATTAASLALPVVATWAGSTAITD